MLVQKLSYIIVVGSSPTPNLCHLPAHPWKSNVRCMGIAILLYGNHIRRCLLFLQWIWIWQWAGSVVLANGYTRCSMPSCFKMMHPDKHASKCTLCEKHGELCLEVLWSTVLFQYPHPHLVSSHWIQCTPWPCPPLVHMSHIVTAICTWFSCQSLQKRQSHSMRKTSLIQTCSKSTGEACQAQISTKTILTLSISTCDVWWCSLA